MEIMRYEYYDKEKDFTKEPYSILPKHKIYPLSEQGINKYLNQRKFILEMLKNNSKLKTSYADKTISIDNPNNSLNDKSQNIFTNTNDNEIKEKSKTSRKGISLNKTILGFIPLWENTFFEFNWFINSSFNSFDNW